MQINKFYQIVTGRCLDIEIHKKIIIEGLYAFIKTDSRTLNNNY